MDKKILLINSESDTIGVLSGPVREAGYEIVTARSGSSRLKWALTEAISLVVLEVAGPALPGFELCRKITTDPATHHLPVIILTDKAGEEDRVKGLEAGADDYVAKPFSPRELLLRIACSIRRSTPLAPSKPKLRVGEFEVDEPRHELRIRNDLVSLTALEFRLIKLFLENPGFVLERSRLLDKVWGYSSTVTTRTVDTHVMRLRTKLGEAGNRIETVRGVGYRFQKPQLVLDLPPLPIEREEGVLALH